MKKILLFLAPGLMFVLSNCKKNDIEEPPVDNNTYQPTPYAWNLGGWSGQHNPKNIPSDNPMTVEGVQLGKRLFYETALSGDNTMSCNSCHKQEHAFSDAPNRFSKGIDGIEGNRNSMPIFNMVFNRDFFWDARAGSLEAQALEPVPNPIELHQQWPGAIDKLKALPGYKEEFKKAFGTENFDSTHASKALAQFMRSIVSVNARFVTNPNGLTLEEEGGKNVFTLKSKGDCTHCHPIGNRLFTTSVEYDPKERIRNNGLDPDPPPGVLTGYARVTGNPADNGRFKAPSLLNIELTAPYMHDGRFRTLEEVIEFYDTGVHINANMEDVIGDEGGSTPNRTFLHGKRQLNLTPTEKKQLVAFLKTLTDQTLVNNPAYKP